ncbi:helix-turn-helix transcriptional regulator [Sphingobacterium humi]|uniref:Helix-turn-helix domain-containing protein n=1 Tax=Sphingobacterium humi TaxID=1796905 RepID=A0A6N8L180_9SPHI|nr:helix-turn-helix domain-containing protein [Sphingobacterium humi]MVZ63493.1 hypothetical protein [Sphingobacterium humi]
MNAIPKTTRIIDLTIDQLDSILEEKFSKLIYNQEEPEFKVGDYNLAMSLTGYSKQRLYQLVSEDLIPHVKLPSGGVRFIQSDLIEWFKKYKVRTSEDIDTIAEKLLLKRKNSLNK